jgi:hypothetical protein
MENHQNRVLPHKLHLTAVVESDEVETRLWGESPKSGAAPQIAFFLKPLIWVPQIAFSSSGGV